MQTLFTSHAVACLKLAHSLGEWWLRSTSTSLLPSIAIARLAQAGIGTRPLSHPMHMLPMYGVARQGGRFPGAESLARQGLNVPWLATLARKDIARVCRELIALAA